jgi:UDP-glucose 4-epimerase
LEQFTKIGLKKFINFSTFQVYGKINRSTVSVKDKVSPLNKYALSHYLSEKIVNFYNLNSTTQCINIRLSNSYGAPIFRKNNCWWLVINDLVKSAYKEKKIELLSDGSPQRDFINMSDICFAIETILKSKEDSFNNTLNLASGKTFSIAEIAKIVKKNYYELYKREIPILFKKNQINSSSPNKFKIDISDLKELGCEPQNKINKTIKDFFRYFEQR